MNANNRTLGSARRTRRPLSGAVGNRAGAALRTRARRLLLTAATLALTGCVGDIHMSFLDPQGPVAQAQMVHFYWVLGIMAVFVAGPIFLSLPFIAWRYRYGNKAARYTPKWRDNKWLVLANWAGPVLIVCGLGFFVWRDAPRLDPYHPIASNQPALEVQVIGYDWKWLFIYPEQHIATIGTFALPVGRPVSMHLTSASVMQSFFIPALGGQIYAMGGMVTQLHLQASQPGCSLGENTMYSGNGFHFQKFTAVAMHPGAFSAWVRKVRQNGVPLDAKLLDAIGKRSTREQLIASLPPAVAHHGRLYLTGVSAELFPHVVKAMMQATSPTPPVTGAPVHEALAANLSPGHACMASEEAP
jgi:cytochrome o ubiquinol oxidase subunit 2